MDKRRKKLCSLIFLATFGLFGSKRTEKPLRMFSFGYIEFSIFGSTPLVFFLQWSSA